MYVSTALIFILIVLDILVYYLQKQVAEEACEERINCRVFSLAEIKLATNDFDDALVIGKGGFGKVYKGKFDFWEGIDVAIKRSNLNSNQGATEFWAEIQTLSKFRHSHIVSLLGYCEDVGTREMILVYEYMPNDAQYRIGAARGLDYLHTGTSVQIRVIHCDVKSANILLDKNLEAKVIGTFGYLDVEYVSTHRVTRKSNVYAFGVVLLEVLCGRRALDFSLDEQQHSLSEWAKHCIREGNIGRIIDPNLRGQVSVNCLKKFGQIAYECLRTCSKDRPTMTKVLARLEFVLAWTLRSWQSASDRKHIGRAILIEKAWSLFSIKAP
ncbi:receptor like protein kinase S.2-like protein, partial [Tanacetum coccineum]